MYLDAKRRDSWPYGSDFSEALRAVRGALMPVTQVSRCLNAFWLEDIPAKTSVILVFSFGMESLKRDPAETKSTCLHQWLHKTGKGRAYDCNVSAGAFPSGQIRCCTIRTLRRINDTWQ